MKREEIGSFLDLKLETDSRVASRFQEDGLVFVKQEHIKVHNLGGLQEIVNQHS